MKTFTSLMIVILLGLCHYVDRLKPETEEISTVEIENENFDIIEYQIDNLKLDTVYYTQKSSNATTMSKAIN